MKQPTKVQLRQTIAEQKQKINDLEEDNKRLKERVNALLKEYDPFGDYLSMEGELFKVVFDDAGRISRTPRVASLGDIRLDPTRDTAFILEMLKQNKERESSPA